MVPYYLHNAPAKTPIEGERLSYELSPLPPRLVQVLLYGRQQVLKHSARAEVDLRTDLHAGRELETLLLNLAV